MRSGTEFSGFWGGIKVDFCVNWSRKRVSVTHLRKCPQHCMSLASESWLSLEASFSIFGDGGICWAVSGLQ